MWINSILYLNSYAICDSRVLFLLYVFVHFFMYKIHTVTNDGINLVIFIPQNPSTWPPSGFWHHQPWYPSGMAPGFSVEVLGVGVVVLPGSLPSSKTVFSWCWSGVTGLTHSSCFVGCLTCWCFLHSSLTFRWNHWGDHPSPGDKISSETGGCWGLNGEQQAETEPWRDWGTLS